MEESFVVKVIHAVVFIAICIAILFIGWNEPLRYRFMSSQEIAAIENPPSPGLPPPWIEGRYRGSRLDEPSKRAGARSAPVYVEPSRGSGTQPNR